VQETLHDKIMPVRGDGQKPSKGLKIRPANPPDQKIVHLRIVLGAGFA
jgi:hypothetical protein